LRNSFELIGRKFGCMSTVKRQYCRVYFVFNFVHNKKFVVKEFPLIIYARQFVGNKDLLTNILKKNRNSLFSLWCKTKYRNNLVPNWLFSLNGYLPRPLTLFLFCILCWGYCVWCWLGYLSISRHSWFSSCYTAAV
jgi:hypothetical protein